jgi:hypothetical protein
MSEDAAVEISTQLALDEARDLEGMIQAIGRET